MRMRMRMVARVVGVALACGSFAANAQAPSRDDAFLAYRQSTIAIVDANVVDGSGTPIRRAQTLVMKDGRIAAMGPRRAVRVPKDAHVIDGRGKTLLPGFVMLHEHMFYPTGERNYAEMVRSFPLLYLAGGTTTLRTAGTMVPYADLNMRAEIQSGRMLGPDMDVTAPYLNGPGLPILAVNALGGVDDAGRMVEYWAAEGVDSYKAYMQIRRDELSRIIELAHARGHRVTAHLCSVTYGEAAAMGIDNLEHGFAVASDFVQGKAPDQCPAGAAVAESLAALPEDSPAMRDLIRTLVERNVAITSTLTVFETFTPGRPQAPAGALELLDPHVRDQYVTAWTAVQGKPSVWSALFPKLAKWERAFVDAGGLLVAGTDPTGFGGVIPGYSGKRQVQLLVEGGFSFEEAVKISTSNGAAFLRRDDEIGTLQVGANALT